MKKIFYILSLLFVLASCTEDVKFNNPAFQGLKDNVFWRAQSYKAELASDGKIVIKGILGYEQVMLQIASTDPKTYALGVDNVTRASYYNDLGTNTFLFSTGPNIGDGQITITEFNSENKTISGTFRFNAPNADETDEKEKVTFTEGVFYKVPVTLTTAFEN